jgi:nucleotide-binding universal stress UspA family protein
MTHVGGLRKILVAVDGSSQSMKGVDLAVSLAKQYDSSLTALYVIHLPLNDNSDPQQTWYKGFKEHAESEARGWFKAIKKKGEENGIKIDAKTVETPKPIPYEIANYAELDGSDIIVIGSKGRSGIERLYLGSVAQGVVTYASCSVIVVR